MSQEVILSNAHVVTRERAFRGSVVFDARGIRAIDDASSQLPGAQDCEGDLLLPGLIEMHTDNVEHHLEPRPGVEWPSSTAALLAHDAQMAAAGITTVLDAICVGDYHVDGRRRRLLNRTAEALRFGREHDMFRAEHLMHLRCEVSDPVVVEHFEPYANDPLVHLVSVMDHTPGQRQWQDLDKMRQFHSRKRTYTQAEFDAFVADRQALQAAHAHSHRRAVLELWKPRGLPAASHDDTTEAHVDEALRDGITIAEFPTTRVAAQHASTHGMVNVAGAPNLVRGGSHSGNVSARELADAGLLNAFSSDYAPVSLLQAALQLADAHAFTLPDAVATVTSNVANMLGMADRGEIAVARRADLVRVRRLPDGVGAVRCAWREGRRVV